jgi:predicted CXXCH cytochrome family protein
MNRRNLLVLWVAATILALLGFGCTAKTPARFPHATHLRSGALTCANCHAVTEATAVGSLHQPGYDICKRCHSNNVGPGEKYSFDLGRTYSTDPEYDHVIFSHKAHTGRTSNQCPRCHRAGQESDADAAKLLPSMADCLQCHRAQYERLQCLECHTRDRLRQLRPTTDVPHGTSYVRHHAADAARKPRLCQTCHHDSFCTDCHDTSTGLKVETRRIDDVKGEYVHRADFVSRHAIEARSQPAACVRCHSSSSCDSCHVRNHVSGNANGSSTPHPRGWIGGELHGRAARRQVMECAACHDQGPATICIGCHKVGGRGGSPHPSGWRSNLSPRDTEMCQYCHNR